MNNHQLINQTSGDVEYYTPQKIIDAARNVMGSITLDPSSSKIANKGVKAEHIFTQEVNGLSQKWFGKVWMNHPFGRNLNQLWIDKIESEYDIGNITEACCITYACTSEKWFQPLLKRPQCFLSPRTNYILPNGTIKRGVTKGSVVTYYGANVDKFAEEFSTLGTIKLCYKK